MASGRAHRSGQWLRRTGLAVVLALLPVLLTANHASAAVDDQFWAFTTDGCGEIHFVDFGPGAPGGGNNDDYTEIYDNCYGSFDDGLGVRARAWVGSEYLGEQFNFSGSATVIWDPFAARGNVAANEWIVLEVSLVSSRTDPTPEQLEIRSQRSVDG